jgi:hypothetical protein
MHLKLLLPDVKTTEFSQPKKMPTSRLRRNEILSAANCAKENSGYSIQGSKRMAISVCKVWI